MERGAPVAGMLPFFVRHYAARVPRFDNISPAKGAETRGKGSRNARQKEPKRAAKGAETRGYAVRQRSVIVLVW